MRIKSVSTMELLLTHLFHCNQTHEIFFQTRPEMSSIKDKSGNMRTIKYLFRGWEFSIDKLRYISKGSRRLQ